MGTTATIHYQPKIPALRLKAECKCGGDVALVCNQRIERKGRRNEIVADARLCMACGTIAPYAEYRHYHDALADFWKEYGWQRDIGLRLTELADLSTETRFESYMALQAGMSPAETAAYLAQRGEQLPIDA
ncbi:MAG: hypothetical protein JSR91_00345 [Proteobacteria bacterium]|nr:hypothetical protein [Pseudomonadota bacterium]